MKTLFLPTNTPPVVYWRMYQFYKKMLETKQSAYMYGFDIKNENMARWIHAFQTDIKVREQVYWLLQNCDVAVLQYYMVPLFFGLQLTFQEDYKKKIFIEVDDELIDVPASSPWVKQGIKPGGVMENLFREQLRAADGIIVSTDFLGELYSKYNKNIHVIPNSIDFKLWKHEVRGTKKIRIGWAGGANHDADLEIMKEVIPPILAQHKDVEFMFFNGIPQYLKEFGNRVKCINRWFDIEKYPEGLASLGFDIGIAPLEDNKFNRCKSNLKWLEYSALKIPTVASNIEPYKKSITQGKTGFLSSSVMEWIENLNILIRSEKLRKRMGKDAYNEVKKKFNLEDTTRKYIKVLEKENEQRRDTGRDTAISQGHGLN